VISAEAYNAPSWARHLLHEGLLADEVPDFQAVHVGFHNLTYFASRHCEWIKGYSLAGRKEHVFEPGKHIGRKCPHLHFVKIMSRWNKSLFQQPHHFAAIIVCGLA